MLFPFVLNIPLGEQYYVRKYWTDLHLIFSIGTYMCGHDESDLLFVIAQGTLLW